MVLYVELYTGIEGISSRMLFSFLIMNKKRLRTETANMSSIRTHHACRIQRREATNLHRNSFTMNRNIWLKNRNA